MKPFLSHTSSEPRLLSHTSPSQAQHPAKLLLSHTPLWHLSSLSLAPARLLLSHTSLAPELPFSSTCQAASLSHTPLATRAPFSHTSLAPKLPSLTHSSCKQAPFLSHTLTLTLRQRTDSFSNATHRLLSLLASS